jgi:hypothetical protein
MPKNLKNFWDDAPYGNPPLTDEMVVKAETILGVKLPQLFIDLLKIKNGGYSKGFVFPTTVAQSWADDHVPLSDVYGIGFEEDTYSIMQSAYLREEWGMFEKLIVISGDGHYFIALDYRKSDTPTVCWIDTECDEDVQIASSFESFIAGLVSGEDFNFED